MISDRRRHTAHPPSATKLALGGRTSWGTRFHFSCGAFAWTELRWWDLKVGSPRDVRRRIGQNVDLADCLEA